MTSPETAPLETAPPAATAPREIAAVKKTQRTPRRAPVTRPVRPPRKARHYVPHILAGLALGGLHVWIDFPYNPVAIAGMALCVYAYVQMGSVNEIVPESETSVTTG